MKKKLRGISLTAVMARKCAGSGYEALLCRFINRKTRDCGIILILMEKANGGFRTIAVSNPVMDGETSEYAFLDASTDDIYASAEVRSGWDARIISIDYNMRKPA